MAAVILAFRRPLSRGPTAASRGRSAEGMPGEAKVADRHARERLSRAPPLSVPEASFATFFLCLDPKDPIETLARLTGVTVGELRGLWRGRRGLRQAALRYALDEALR
jgi:hypothetical protein